MSFSTADLCDQWAAELESGQVRILRGDWCWFGLPRRFCGQLVTLVARGCNVELRELLAEPGEGRVLLVDADGHPGALLGDNLAGLAARNGWAGVVINGNVRDREAMASIELGILALGTWPERSQNNKGGQRDALLVIGGLLVNSGEWLYADQDGVVIATHQLAAN